VKTRILLLASVLWVGLSLPAIGGDLPEIDNARQAAVANLTERIAPSLVRIETVGGAEKVGAVVVGQATTTGVIVSADGWIVASAYGLAHRPVGIVLTFADGARRAGVKVVIAGA
jgi:serine protease Do